VVELTHRDGTLLEQNYTMGGNLGLYGEFATYFDSVVTVPQAALVGAFLDHSRVPVSLYLAGAGLVRRWK
jgi:hypothetical protein